MADNRDELDLDGTETAAIEGATKRTAGLAALLPNLLKFVAIGLGALIFIVTVSFITYKLLAGSGKSQTATAESPAYEPARQQYSWFTEIGVIRTRTNDTTPYSVVVNLIIGYKQDDKIQASELTNRIYELKDFVRNFFSKKSAAELKPEFEEQLKKEIKDELNMSILQKAKAQEILFQQLDVVEM